MPGFASAALRPWISFSTAFVLGARRASQLALTVELALQVRRERRMLMRLDERALQDIGYDKGRAYGEGTRSFWDVPVDRLRC